MEGQQRHITLPLRRGIFTFILGGLILFTVTLIITMRFPSESYVLRLCYVAAYVISVSLICCLHVRYVRAYLQVRTREQIGDVIVREIGSEFILFTTILGIFCYITFYKEALSPLIMPIPRELEFLKFLAMGLTMGATALYLASIMLRVYKTLLQISLTFDVLSLFPVLLCNVFSYLADVPFLAGFYNYLAGLTVGLGLLILLGLGTTLLCYSFYMLARTERRQTSASNQIRAPEIMLGVSSIIIMVGMQLLTTGLPHILNV